MRFYTLNEIELAKKLAFEKLVAWKTKWLSTESEIEIISFEQKIFNEEVIHLKGLDAAVDAALKIELIFGQKLNLGDDSQVFLLGLWGDLIYELSLIFDAKLPFLGLRNETILFVCFRINAHIFTMGISESLSDSLCPPTDYLVSESLPNTFDLIVDKKLNLVVRTEPRRVYLKEIGELKPGDIISLGHSVNQPFYLSTDDAYKIAEAYLARNGDNKVILIEK